jgi:hypothetical protein
MRIFRVGLVGGFTLAVALVLSEIAGHCSEGRNAKKGRRRADEPMQVLTDRSPAHNGCDFRWSQSVRVWSWDGNERAVSLRIDYL